MAALYQIPVERLLSQESEIAAKRERAFLRAEEVSAPIRMVLRRFHSLCEEYARLERLVQGTVTRLPVEYRTGELGRNPVDQGVRLAHLERQRLGLGEDPVLNMAHLAELTGIKVFVVRVPQARSLVGAAFTSEDVGSAMLINVGTADGDYLVPGRLNFTAAHEYAHLVLDTDRDPLDLENYLADAKPYEQRANAFAAAFLMPSDAIWRELVNVGWRPGKPVDPGLAVHLSIRFGTSYEATLWRLRAVEVIDEEERARLREAKVIAWTRILGYWDAFEAQAVAWRSVPETPPTDFPPPTKFKLLVLQGYREGRISAGRAAALLGEDREKVEAAVWAGVDKPQLEIPEDS